MNEIRLVLIASLSGDAESVIDEQLFPVDEGDPVEAAERAAAWLRERADGLLEEAHRG